MKNSAFDNFSEGTMDVVYEAYDFKQCQKKDGSIYGIPDSSDCNKGKEVKPSEGGVGLFGPTGGDNAKKASKGELKVKELGSQATIDLISAAAKMDGVSSKDKAKVIQMGYKHLANLAKGEGKEPPTLTSIVSGAQLKKLGIDPDKANVKSGSRGKDDTKKAREAKINAEADEFLKNLRNGRKHNLLNSVVKPNMYTKEFQNEAKAFIDKGLKDAKAKKDDVKIKAFSKLQQQFKDARSTQYLNVDWSDKSIDEVIRVAEEIKGKMKAGTLTDKEGAKKVQAEIKSRLARRKKFGNLADTNNRAAHSQEAQKLMTQKEAESFYAGNPSICTGDFKQYYKTVCRRLF